MDYDVYLNNHGPEVWKSKRLSELLLLISLQKDEEKDAISLEKCGLYQVFVRDDEASPT